MHAGGNGAGISAEDRFWSRVVKTDSCWYYSGYIGPSGYPLIRVGNWRGNVHRYAYVLLVGELDDDQDVDHTCHNVDQSCPGGPTCLHRRCVNPAHLEATTPQENTLRGKSIQAKNARKTRCDGDHEFSAENTYRDPQGRRQCRKCRREGYHRRKAMKGGD